MVSVVKYFSELNAPGVYLRQKNKRQKPIFRLNALGVYLENSGTPRGRDLHRLADLRNRPTSVQGHLQFGCLQLLHELHIPADIASNYIYRIFENSDTLPLFFNYP